MDRTRFISTCTQLLYAPSGPEAQQLATYIGWKMRGYAGGLVSGLLFILPGFVSIMVLSLLYGWSVTNDLRSHLSGPQGSSNRDRFSSGSSNRQTGPPPSFPGIIAALSFSFLLFLKLPFPWILLMAALAGWRFREFGQIGLALVHLRKSRQSPSIGGRCGWDPEEAHRASTACFGHHFDLHHTLVPTRCCLWPDFWLGLDLRSTGNLL